MTRAHQTPSTLGTPRLRLVPVTQSMKVAFQHSRAAFERSIGAALPQHWPQFAQAFAPGPTGPVPASFDAWPGYVFVLRSLPQVVGNGGFVGPPGPTGEVEIGYEIAPAWRDQGYAAEAARALVTLAFEQGAEAVLAHTLNSVNASNKVLVKLGMRLATTLPHATLGVVRRYRVCRSDFVDAFHASCSPIPLIREP